MGRKSEYSIEKSAISKDYKSDKRGSFKYAII